MIVSYGNELIWQIGSLEQKERGKGKRKGQISLPSDDVSEDKVLDSLPGRIRVSRNTQI